MPFYAVAHGVRVGIYQTWSECEKQVKGFSGAKFKKFISRAEAERFIAQVSPPPVIKIEPGVGNNQLEQYLSKKYSVVDVKGFSSTVKSNDKRTTKIKIEKKDPVECEDYIPLENLNENKKNIKKELKSENDETSLWFADEEGDQELLLALSALQEYPDQVTNPKNGRKRKASDDQAAMPLTKHIRIGSYNFTMDNEGFIDAYIAGHCENNNNWNCVSGYGVYFGDNHELNCSKAATGRITSNVGDIEAAIHAIKSALEAGVAKLCLHTGSEFLLNVVTSWMFSWKRKGWRNQAGKVVQNRKELTILDGLLANDNISVKWHNVKGFRNALKPMREVQQLARLGNEKYLELHPRKEMDNSVDEFEGFGFDFY